MTFSFWQIISNKSKIEGAYNRRSVNDGGQISEEQLEELKQLFADTMDQGRIRGLTRFGEGVVQREWCWRPTGSAHRRPPAGAR